MHLLFGQADGLHVSGEHSEEKYLRVKHITAVVLFMVQRLI